MNQLLPKVGDVYETSLSELRILLCIHVRRLVHVDGHAFDFLVLDGDRPPSIRTWSQHSLSSDCTMETTMRNFKFSKIAEVD